MLFKNKSKIKIMSKLVRPSHVDIHISNACDIECLRPSQFSVSSFLSSSTPPHPLQRLVLSSNTLYFSSIAGNLLEFTGFEHST